MIRLFLFLCVVACVSFGAGVAQSDVFLRKSDTVETSVSKAPSRPGVFLRPSEKNSVQDRKGVNAITYGSRLDMVAAKKDTLADLNSLQAWQASGRKPETAEEFLSYAAAYRAPARAQMLQRREQLSAYVIGVKQKNAAAFEARMAARADGSELLEEEKKGRGVAVSSKSAGSVSAYQTPPQTRSITRSPTQVYRAPSDTTSKKPSRVFTDYR